MEETKAWVAAMAMGCSTAITITMIVAHYCYLGVIAGGTCIGD